jgi:hypothetical protein
MLGYLEFKGYIKKIKHKTRGIEILKEVAWWQRKRKKK